MALETEKLTGMLDDISTRLKSLGEKRWANWFADDSARLRRGDLTAIDHFLSAFGGTGSINDLYICPENGHQVPQTEVVMINKQLSKSISAAWELARISIKIINGGKSDRA